MSTMYDGVDRGTLALAVQLTIDAHTERDEQALAAGATIDAHRATPGQTGRAPGCQSCTPHGCQQLDWANQEAAKLASGRTVR